MQQHGKIYGDILMLYGMMNTYGLFFLTGVFPTQMTSNAENVSIWWRHYAFAILWQDDLSSVYAITFSWYHSTPGLDVRRQM